MSKLWATPPLQKSVLGLKTSPTVAINERCDALRREGRAVYKMGLGQSPFPVPEPVVEALQTNAWRKDYLAVRGLPALRDAVAEYHRRRHDTSVTGEDVLVGPGSKELMFLLQVVFDGELLVPTPAWVSYAPQARILNRNVLLPTTHASDGWRLTAAQLEAHCANAPSRPRVLLLNYPSNPTGCTYDEAELMALAEVARRYQVIVLSDEIYGELHFQGAHTSIARMYPEGTIVSSGLSKWCGAGGWRLGTFLFPSTLRWLLEAMTSVASESYTSTSAPIQYAAIRAFEGGPRIEHYLTQSRRVLSSLMTQARGQLLEAGAQVAEPAGAFYLFPDLSAQKERFFARGITNSRTLCARLLEEAGVAALPGEDFGRDADELTLRLALVDFDGARALSAADTIATHLPLDGGFLRSYCSSVLTAVERFSAWLKDPRPL